MYSGVNTVFISTNVEQHLTYTERIYTAHCIK